MAEMRNAQSYQEEGPSDLDTNPENRQVMDVERDNFAEGHPTDKDFQTFKE